VSLIGTLAQRIENEPYINKEVMGHLDMSGIRKRRAALSSHWKGGFLKYI